MERGRPTCASHPGAAAGWHCLDCERTLCPACAVLKHFHPVDVLACGPCGGRAEVLRIHRAHTPLADQLRGIWRFPIHAGSLPTLLMTALWVVLFESGTALILLGLDLFETLWALLPAAAINIIYVVGLLCAWMMGIVRRTWTAPDALEPPEVTDLWNDVLRPAGLAVIGSIWLWAPALLRILSAGRLSLADPALWVLGAVLVVYAPALLLVASTGASTLQVANPLQIVGAIQALGVPYLRVLSTVAPAAIAAIVLQVASVRAWAFFPLLGPWALQVAALYPLAVFARALGLLLRVHGDRLGYGREIDYLEPALPGIEPTGQRGEIFSGARSLNGA